MVCQTAAGLRRGIMVLVLDGIAMPAGCNFADFRTLSIVMMR